MPRQPRNTPSDERRNSCGDRKPSAACNALRPARAGPMATGPKSTPSSGRLGKRGGVVAAYHHADPVSLLRAYRRSQCPRACRPRRCRSDGRSGARAIDAERTLLFSRIVGVDGSTVGYMRTELITLSSGRAHVMLRCKLPCLQSPHKGRRLLAKRNSPLRRWGAECRSVDGT